MKKLFFGLLLITAPSFLLAQNGTKFLGIKGAIGLKYSTGAVLSYDYNTKYFNQNEIFAKFYFNEREYAFKAIEDSLSDVDHDSVSIKRSDYYNVMVGFAMKPVLLRKGNSILRLRLGVGIGTDSERFLAAPQIGFEFSQTLPGGVDVVIGNRNQVVFFAPDTQRWRMFAELGIRIPLK